MVAVPIIVSLALDNILLCASLSSDVEKWVHRHSFQNWILENIMHARLEYYDRWTMEQAVMKVLKGKITGVVYDDMRYRQTNDGTGRIVYILNVQVADECYSNLNALRENH
jgi:hypothetical protein